MTCNFNFAGAVAKTYETGKEGAEKILAATKDRSTTDEVQEALELLQVDVWKGAPKHGNGLYHFKQDCKDKLEFLKGAYGQALDVTDVSGSLNFIIEAAALVNGTKLDLQFESFCIFTTAR